MSNVPKWSPFAGNNTDAPPDGAPENMLRSAVNNTMREMMGAIARWYGDQKATLLTGGTGNAYTLTTNSAYAAFSELPLLSFRANRSNTGPITLNVDGLGPKPVSKTSGLVDFLAGDIVNGQTIVVTYNINGGGGFELIGPTPPGDGFPAGTTLPFRQSAAPTGWTKDVSRNDYAMRVVSGSIGSDGGTANFSTVFAARTLVEGNLPPHTHNSGTLAGTTNVEPNHTHSYANGGGVNSVSATSTNVSVANASSGTTGGAGSHSHTVTLTGATAAGSGTSTPLDFAVKYCDMILATKA